MGLFDFIFNRTKNEDYGGAISSENSPRKKRKIPERYLEFPEYPGVAASKPKSIETDNYYRLTMMYKGEPIYDYIRTIEFAGYVKGSEVRFDKDNTYIIVEKIGNKTKIAYHIKKQAIL